MLAARYPKKVTGVEPKSPPGGQLEEILCAAIRLLRALVSDECLWEKKTNRYSEYCKNMNEDETIYMYICKYDNLNYIYVTCI